MTLYNQANGLTQNEIHNILNVIAEFAIYLYPGLISLKVYRFAKDQRFEETKTSLIKCFAISFVYVQFAKIVLPFINCILSAISIRLDGEVWLHVILLLLAISVPLLFWRILTSDRFKRFLCNIHITTNVYNNVFDLISCQGKTGCTLAVYSDELKEKYVGALRNYSHGTDEKKYVFLSDYMMYSYVPETGKYQRICDGVTIHDATNEGLSKNWLAIEQDKISKIEILYEKPQ